MTSKHLTVLAMASSLTVLLTACERRLEPPTLREALMGLGAADSIPITLHTSQGPVRCELQAEKAPRAVAMFVGLARGHAAWRDPRIDRIVQTPLYRDLTFFRAIPGALVQSGCPLGNGTGHPGYRLPVETAKEDLARLSRPGALLLARYQPAPNRRDPAPPPAGRVIGSQFAVTLTDMRHLAGKVTVMGACTQLEVVARLAERVAAGRSERLHRVSVNLPAQ